MHEKVAEPQLCWSVSASRAVRLPPSSVQIGRWCYNWQVFCFFFFVFLFSPTVGLKVDGESTRESGLILEW